MSLMKDGQFSELFQTTFHNITKEYEVRLISKPFQSAASENHKRIEAAGPLDIRTSPSALRRLATLYLREETGCSLPPEKTGCSLPSEKTCWSLPSEENDCSLPSKETGCS
nr:hypothetical protein [Tanacetum cinerariifolium]